MATFIEGLIKKVVQVITIEGRVFLGTLISFDKNTNVILDNCVERIYVKNKPIKEEKIGYYFIKGDNVALISDGGELKKKEDISHIKADPIKEFII